MRVLMILLAALWGAVISAATQPDCKAVAQASSEVIRNNGYVPFQIVPVDTFTTLVSFVHIKDPKMYIVLLQPEGTKAPTFPGEKFEKTGSCYNSELKVGLDIYHSESTLLTTPLPSPI